MATSPAKIKSKRDQAYNQLRRLLILQQIPEGQRLRETEWAQKLGVNRSALREALVRLAAEGLIVAGPKKGFFVPAVTPKEFEDIVKVRLVLEGSAIDIICQSRLNTREHLKPLIQACDLFEQLIGDEYYLSAAEADHRFHETLVELSRNRRLAAAYRHAPLPMIQPDIIFGKEWLVVERCSLAEHRELIEAILQGDTNRAKTCLDEHLRGLRQPFGSKYIPP
jgi:DNA-binding GntR family transcriptional regulator